MFGASKWLRSRLAAAYSMIYQMIFCFMAIQFVYRHVLISGSTRKLKWFKGAKVLYWVLYTAGFSIIWILLFVSCLPDPYSMSYVKEEMEENYGIPVEEVAGFFIVVYEPQTSLTTWRIRSIVCIVGLSFVLCCHYAVIFYCSLKIYTKIKGLTSMTSSKTNRLQFQLFLTLILQIATPAIFHHLPVVFMYYAPFLNLKLSFPSGIMIGLFSAYPAVDSWIMMGVVNEYKKSLRQLIHNRSPSLTTAPGGMETEMKQSQF